MPRTKKAVKEEKKQPTKIEGNVEILLDLIEKMYGPHARKILEIIITTKEPIGEEAIGKMIGIKSNEARRIIQRLAGESIIRFRRLRKGDKGIHAWFLNEDQVEGILLTRLKKTLGKLKARLNFLRENTIFVCPKCGRRYTFDEAMVNDFRCIDDGEMLEEYDASEEISFLEKKISEIEEDLRRAGAL